MASKIFNLHALNPSRALRISRDINSITRVATFHNHSMIANNSLNSLNAIIIGAGFGGLSTSIELARRGAKVHIFEAAPDMKRQGDVIQIGANATRLMEPWGKVLHDVENGSALPDLMSIMKKNGEVLLDQQLHTQFGGYINAYGNRGIIQRALYDCAKSLGVEISLGAPVSDIFESGTSAGVVVGVNKYEADCVIAADGVRGKARNYVTGVESRPKKSGFAVYRSWFPLEVLKENYLTKEIAASETPLFRIWIATDTHAILTTNPTLKSATCFVTHKDLSDIEEDWNLKGEIKDMLACVEGWDPQLCQIIQRIPTDCLIDYKLLWRDPVPKWVSDNGRVCLVGDAAHPHLATSGTGAAQAIEGAATIGSLFEKCSTALDIPLLFQAYQKLRYERTSLTQRLGWETRHVWHQTDWEAVATNPEFLKFPQPEWLLGHDAGKYAENNFEAVISHLRHGTPFESTNVPEGYKHEEWTIETMLSREGQLAEKNFYKTRA